MSRNISSDDISEPLPTTIGEGIEFEAKSFHSEGTPAITARESYEFDENGLRKCHMTIRSWVGVSIGAVHSYVDLMFYGCTVHNLDGTRHKLAGTYPNNIPEIAERTTIKHAAELLEADARDLRAGHNVDPQQPDWKDEPTARAMHDDALCTALRLRMLARRIKDGRVAVSPALTSGARHA